MALESGAPRASGTALRAAVERFFEDRPDLRVSTQKLYRSHVGTFLAWARDEGIRSGDELTRASLLNFRGTRLRAKRSAPVKGGRKGSKRRAATARKPASVNAELRAIRGVLGYVRELGLAARLSEDDLRVGLKALPVPKDAPAFLRPDQIRELLEAADQHDRVTFQATRDEHKRGEGGATPRYTAIAPFVRTVLLTGMRRSEALSVRWEQVDLEAVDHDGRPVGEIRLTSEQTKTKNGRVVGLEVSPMLRTLLVELRPKVARGPVRGPVFDLTSDQVKAAKARLMADFGAPTFTWQTLRSTCATYLVNAPGIFHSASIHLSAKQLGHSVQVAEQRYTGVVRGIPREARTLEKAMGIGDL